MSEFKITHKTTLYELQEYCKNQVNCQSCELRENTQATCNFTTKDPIHWNIQKPKTYKEDFLEKFPKADFEELIEESCVQTIYGTKQFCNYKCEECWNEIMKEVKNEDL